MGDRAKISLSGLPFDMIKILGDRPQLQAAQCIGDQVLNGGQWSRIADSLAFDGVYTPTRESTALAFARTRVADLWPDLERRNRPPPIEVPTPVRYMLGETHLRGSELDIIMNTLHATTDRRFFTTHSGYMGLAPFTAQEGDVIYLLLVGDVPYALRPSPEGKEFTFVGECYAHGLMDGEGLIAARAQKGGGSHSEDMAWLDHLDTEPLPSDTEEVILR